MPTRSASRALRWLTAIVASLVLGGCALPRMIDSDVQSFVGTPAAVAGASYRFERLPSQQAQGAAHERVEALAQEALGRAGLVRDEAHPRYSIQVEVSVLQFQPAPRRQPHFGGPYIAADGALFYPPPMLLLEPPWYSHTVHLLMRDVSTAQVAFESTASFDGPWSDSANLLPIIFEAALRGYPNPPPGPRKVVIELPATGQETR
jgi:hypothetical protein